MRFSARPPCQQCDYLCTICEYHEICICAWFVLRYFISMTLSKKCRQRGSKKWHNPGTCLAGVPSGLSLCWARPVLQGGAALYIPGLCTVPVSAHRVRTDAALNCWVTDRLRKTHHNSVQRGHGYQGPGHDADLPIGEGRSFQPRLTAALLQTTYWT